MCNLESKWQLLQLTYWIGTFLNRPQGSLVILQWYRTAVDQVMELVALKDPITMTILEEMHELMNAEDN